MWWSTFVNISVHRSCFKINVVFYTIILLGYCNVEKVGGAGVCLSLSNCSVCSVCCV